MKTPIALAVALGVLSTAAVTPARADPATAWIVVGAVLAGSTLKCAISPNRAAIDSLCWLSPLTYVGIATAIAAPRGNITVKPVRKKKRA